MDLCRLLFKYPGLAKVIYQNVILKGKDKDAGASKFKEAFVLSPLRRRQRVWVQHTRLTEDWQRWYGRRGTGVHGWLLPAMPMAGRVHARALGTRVWPVAPVRDGESVGRPHGGAYAVQR